MTHDINNLPGYSRRKVTLAGLRVDQSRFQPRSRGVNSDQVASLVSALRRGSKFAPLDVWEDQDGTLYLVHGHHRHQALLTTGRRKADAHVYRCSLAEVRLIAIAENSHDRLSLSVAERSQFAWQLDGDHGGAYNATLLATSAGISRRTVYNMRGVRQQLLDQGAEVPALWIDAKAAVKSQTWECSADEREAIFRERKAKLRDRISGPIGYDAQRDPEMVFDVIVDALGQEVFAKAAAARGFHQGYFDEFTGEFHRAEAVADADPDAAF